ncbi:IgA Peptidase M64 [Luteimonas sp. 50]|uniref:IgA Peptidase M64 n=1 Tax=Cognatiluteimonas sedimenti TaxID=2927791 RepID=A0ABT0A6I6_9GAMM|nr:IgA Peptidase M64 [Lysobacter sedimenti]MCJ0826574.1 IgA Peptidase M64 [Lysobacter sedimenti]
MRAAILLLAILLPLANARAMSPPASRQATPATLRVDIQHGGDASAEHYALERVVVEPLPWPGNPARPLDTTNRGSQKFEVVDAGSGQVLYSRGYATVFGEWRTTDDARTTQRSFQESMRFPMPAGPVLVKVYGRDADNRFAPAWSVRIDPQALDVERVALPAPAQPIAIRHHGDPATKVDLLLLGDGYTAAQMDKFRADARRLADRLFSVSPFKERAADFNVWALALPVPEAGISRPSTGIHHASATGARYDIFGSERYILTLDNRAFRELAQYAPYEFVEIMVNNQTYGGGGIFGQFSTVAADNDWADYVFVHEFGHHFAGLADEYYTSPVAYAAGERPTVEPWEPNVTALLDPGKLKWKDQVSPVAPAQAVPLPTPWPKAEYEAYERDVQARRVKLRADRRPEAEMSALFREEQDHVDALFADARYRDAVGAFEGANYAATGYYRPQMQCMMFTRADAFCSVCQRAIADIIDLYTTAPRPGAATARGR